MSTAPHLTRTLPVAAWLGLTAFLLGTSDARGQDSHYWSEQYGTRAALLGGTVIGSVRDLSAVYYNPGAVALNPDAGFILSARAYRQGTLTVEDGAGEGRDLASTNTRPIATLLATPLDFDFLGRHQLVYSVLTRQEFNTDVLSYRVDEGDFLSAPGTEGFAGAFRGGASLRETWTGVAWAYPLTERLGIGVAPYLALRNREIRSQFLVQTSTESGDVASAIRLRTRRFSNWRAIAKLGLSYQSEGFSLGMTATTPSLFLTGNGLASYNRSATTSLADPDFIDTPYLAANVQTDLKSTFKSAWTVGGGAGLLLGGTRLHASAEWFQAPDPFLALDAEDFIPQTGGDPVVNDIAITLQSVLNWGFGVEQSIGSALVYASVATDNSAADPGIGILEGAATTKYDLTRIGGGASFRLSRLDLMLGASYASGRNPFPRLFEDDDISPDIDPEPDTFLSLSEWTFVIGVEFLPGNDDDSGS
jgi:hypothetical protein